MIVLIECFICALSSNSTRSPELIRLPTCSDIHAFVISSVVKTGPDRPVQPVGPKTGPLSGLDDPLNRLFQETDGLMVVHGSDETHFKKKKD